MSVIGVSLGLTGCSGAATAPATTEPAQAESVAAGGPSTSAVASAAARASAEPPPADAKTGTGPFRDPLGVFELTFSGAWSRLGEKTSDIGEGETISTYSILHRKPEERIVEQIDVRDLSGATSYECEKNFSLGLEGWAKSIGCTMSGAKPTKFGPHAALAFDIVSCPKLKVRGRGLAVCDVSKLSSGTAHTFKAIYLADEAQYSESKAAAFLATLKPL